MGVGDEYELPKKWPEWLLFFHLWSVRMRITFGLGYEIIREYIACAFGRVGGNQRCVRG